MSTDLAQVAYDAYCQTTDWKSAVTGAPLPAFALTSPLVKQAWSSAAKAVTDKVLDSVEARIRGMHK